MLPAIVGEQGYLQLLEHVLQYGQPKPVHGKDDLFVHSVLGAQLRFDISNMQLPVLTTKKVLWQKAIAELLWFIRGSSNIASLQADGCNVWDDYAYKQNAHNFADKADWQLNACEWDMDSKAPYGPALRHFTRDQNRKNGEGIDQLATCISRIENEPNRKHNLVSYWDPRYHYENALLGQSVSIVPCHFAFHVVINGGKLGLHMMQRSCDLALGGPWNMVQYATLAHILAKVTGYEADEFVWTISDAHIYSNQLEAVKQQLERTPKAQPRLKLSAFVNKQNLLDGKLQLADFELEGYESQGFLKVAYHVAGGK